MDYCKFLVQDFRNFELSLMDLNPFLTENPITDTLANSEDPDKMWFHQCLHCLLRQNWSSEKEK